MDTQQIELFDNLHICAVFYYFCNLLHPSAAQLFISIFHSLANGIADAISSLNWRRNIYIYEK